MLVQCVSRQLQQPFRTAYLVAAQRHFSERNDRRYVERIMKTPAKDFTVGKQANRQNHQKLCERHIMF